MAMDDWFDGLAKDSAHRFSRREVFGRLAAGLGTAVLLMLGMRTFASRDCGKLCVACCRNNFPDGGREFGECVSQCHHGEGICGPIVCPESSDTDAPAG
jgi:hypothetical protein